MAATSDYRARFVPTIEKDIRLCKNLIKLENMRSNPKTAVGYTQLQACQDAGFPYRDASRASLFLKKRMQEEKFVQILDAIRKGLDPAVVLENDDISIEIIDDERKVLRGYTKLFALCTNITLKNNKGDLLLYNPSTARQVLKDLGEIHGLFQHDDRATSLVNTIKSIKEIDLMISKLENTGFQHMIDVTETPRLISDNHNNHNDQT